MNTSLPDQLYCKKWLLTQNSSPISAWLFAIVTYDMIAPALYFLLSSKDTVAAPWHPLISNRSGLNAITQRFRSIP